MRNPGNVVDARRRARAIPALLLVLALPFALRCGGGDEATAPLPERPTFTPTSTPEAPNVVRLSDGVGLRSDQIQIEVTIGGPTTSSDIFSVLFDIAFSDPSLVSTLDFAAGDVFSGDPLTDVIVAVGEVDPEGKVAVGISKAGGDVGDGVDADGATIVTIVFTTHHAGSTDLWLEGGQALDPEGNGIDSVIFDDGEATITQP